MSSNEAAWLNAQKAPLEVKPAPYPTPAEDELVIKNGAIAINPIDWIGQESLSMAFSWIKPPFIMGTDAAGEVVQVGSSVTRFKVGDRVVCHCVGANKKYNTAAKGAFQLYPVALERITSPIPDSMSYESACVLPLALSTAACGLFEKDQLALAYPSASAKSTSSHKATPTSTILIWSGASSVGSCAIQLAIASGYRVITTCSPSNNAHVTRLGAAQAFDYNSPTVVTDIIAALKDRELVGAMSIGHGAAELCVGILRHCRGNRFLSMASYPTPPVPFTWLVIPRTIMYMGPRLVSLWVTAWARGIKTKFIFGESLIDNEVGKLIYEEFLPAALEDGRFVAAPEPMVVGEGLESLQGALDVQRKGVRARKVVVTI